MDSLDSTGFFNAPVSNITPFTYRDGETYLEQLRRLRIWAANAISQLQDNINSVQDHEDDAIQGLTDQLNSVLNKFLDEWNAELIELEAQNPEVAFDPTTGDISPLNLVIGHVYDNTRYYAYFADQLDAFNKTAADWDAMQYTARHFDLALAYSPTTTQATDTVPATVNPS